MKLVDVLNVAYQNIVRQITIPYENGPITTFPLYRQISRERILLVIKRLCIVFANEFFFKTVLVKYFGGDGYAFNITASKSPRAIVFIVDGT